MKINQKTVFLILGLLVFIIFPLLVRAEDEAPAASGLRAHRLEQEDRITVPLDKTEEVWDYLREKYVNDTATIKQLDPLLASYSDEEDFTDTYFDTSSLQLLAKGNCLRHRKRLNLTNPNDRKSGRELIQIKVSNISDNSLNRGEMKFDVDYHSKVKFPEDQILVLGVIKRSQREEFKSQLTKLGVDPYALKPILTIRDLRRRIYMAREKKPFLGISLDHATSRCLRATADFVEIEFELNEITYTEADAVTRKYMESINSKIIKDIMEKFPYLKRDLTPKYQKTFNQLEARLPNLRSLIGKGK